MSNKAQSKNYSYLALVVALIALIATLLLGITRGLVAMDVFTVANVDNLNRAIILSIGVIVLGLAMYAILEPDRVRRTFTGRQARYGSNAAVMIIAFLFILIFGTGIVLANPVTIADMTVAPSMSGKSLT